MLPAISELLSGSVTESLKNVFKPAYLFTAALFFFLNLVFFLAPARELDTFISPFADELLSLDTAWLLAVGSAAVLILAYILSSLNTTIYRLMTGETWERLPLFGSLSRAIQRLRFQSMSWRIDHTAPDHYDYGRLKYNRQLRFAVDERHGNPHVDEGLMAPTMLGNILNAAAYRLQDRYNMDFTALWPHMQVAIEDKTALKRTIDQEKAGLDFLLAVAFTLFAFVLEGLVVDLAARGPLLLTGFHYLLILALAYGVYRAAALKAITWGQAVLTAFAQEQDSLRKVLSMQPAPDRAAARKRWGLVSEFLIFGDRSDRKEELDEIFNEKKAETPVAISAVASPNVAREFQHEKVCLPLPQTAAFNQQALMGVHYYDCEIRYLLLISNALPQPASAAYWAAAEGVFCIVHDERLPWIDALPAPGSPWDVNQATPSRLIWAMTRPLNIHETVQLAYSMPIPIWSARSNHMDLVFDPARCSVAEQMVGQKGYEVRLWLDNRGTGAIMNGTINFFHAGLADSNLYYIDPPEYLNARLRQPCGFCLNVPPIQPGQGRQMNIFIRRIIS